MKAMIHAWPMSLCILSAVLLDCLFRAYIGLCGLAPDTSVHWSVLFLLLILVQEAYPGRLSLPVLVLGLTGYLTVAFIRLHDSSDPGVSIVNVIEFLLLAVFAMRKIMVRRASSA